VISLNRASENGGSVESILLTPTIICLTPRVKARRACSRVWPFLEIPASNSPTPAATIRTAQSAWEVPDGQFKSIPNIHERTSNHVLDEISVSGSVDDGDVEFRSFELPESNIDGDTSFSFGLKLVQNPGVLERAFAHFGGFLLELLDGSLVDTTALVDQVTGGCRFTRIDVADNDDVNVSLFFSHVFNLYLDSEKLTLERDLCQSMLD
jgi:hypothetical protein